MSILAKGLKMPDCCLDCPCLDGEYCRCNISGKSIRSDKGRLADCPLIELPDHGDLIDMDELLNDLEYDIEMDAKALDDTNIVGAERIRLQFDKDCKQNCMFYLTEQAVVIPAERNEE